MARETTAETPPQTVPSPAAGGRESSRPPARGPIRGRGRRRSGIRGREAPVAWAFVTPMIVVFGLFMVLPILMAAWVSVSDWTGKGSPLASGVGFVGFENYADFFVGGGLAQTDLMTSVRNTFYFVLLVVPIQTVLAMALAILLNSRRLKAKGFFRSAYYFPSVTSSVAIAVVFLFLFSSDGPVNIVLRSLGANPPNWFADARGLIHIVAGELGVRGTPGWASGEVGGLTVWEWLAGPSVAMTSIIMLCIWVSVGGYMLIFLSSLQSVDEEIYEAAVMDGATTWQRIRHITMPILRPTTVLVVTLGLIGTWQVFDQVYIMSQGNPGKTTLSPAYLSYSTSFMSNEWGQGAAIAFMLFALIIVLTIIQRTVSRDRSDGPRRRGARGRGRS